MLEWSTSFYDADSYDVWREEINKRGLIWSLDKKVDPEFNASDCIMPFSKLAIFDCVVGCFGGKRVRKDISASDREVYDLILLNKGKARIDHAGLNTSISNGTMVIWDTEQECRFKVEEPLKYSAVSVPKEILHSLTNNSSIKPGTLDSKAGFGAVLSICIVTAIANARDFASDEGDRFEDMLLDLIIGAFHSEKTIPTESGKQKTLRRIQAYIDQNLSDADLTPRSVAEAVNVSVRYLHLLFASQNLTFNTYLYAARLNAIRHELAGRQASYGTLTQLSHHYGFKDGAHFSRLFRKKFGMSPSQYRRQNSW